MISQYATKVHQVEGIKSLKKSPRTLIQEGLCPDCSWPLVKDFNSAMAGDDLVFMRVKCSHQACGFHDMTSAHIVPNGESKFIINEKVIYGT